MIGLEFELERRKRKLKNRKQKRDFLLWTVGWMLLLWVLLYGIFGIAFVEGSSMRPAYYEGDLVLYQRRFLGEPDYGDVVIARMHMEGKDINVIKRIAGRPGDVIDIDEKGHLTRNGEVSSESEVKFGSQAGEDWVGYPYTVPEGSYFCLGDNRPVSLDSRVMGSVEREDIIGRVFGQFRISVGNK